MKVIRLDGAQSELRASVARALAQALITGIDQAEQEGRKLTQLQQIDMATMTVMSYEEALDSVHNLEISYMLERQK